MTDNVNRLVREAVQNVQEWAARTRPLLSDPPEGQEWQVYLHPLTESDILTDRDEIKMRYEWVLVDVAS